MDDKSFWEFAFITVAGWGFHPGYNKPTAEKFNIGDAALMADAMLEIRRKRWPSDGSQH